MKTVDLFAGCGGFSLGFQNAGFEIVAAIENWEAAIKIYNMNFTHKVICQDLNNVFETIDVLKNFEPNIIIGGPPCQDFSHAGKRNENQGRGNLTISVAKIVANIRPEYFVMENVDRLINTSKYKEAYQKTNFKKGRARATIALKSSGKHIVCMVSVLR